MVVVVVVLRTLCYQIRRPIDFQWRVRRYHDVNKRLIATDIDHLPDEAKVRKGWEGKGRSHTPGDNHDTHLLVVVGLWLLL